MGTDNQVVTCKYLIVKPYETVTKTSSYPFLV